MTRSIAAIVAIVAIMFAVAGCAGGAGPSVEATTPIPDELRYVWLGPARDISALGGPQPLSIIRIARGEREPRCHRTVTGSVQKGTRCAI